MIINEMLLALNDKDTKSNYDILLQLEKMSLESNVLYQYIDLFIDLMKEPRNDCKVRGVRLFCKQAQWDCKQQIKANIQIALKILDSDKPTTVRQTLAALMDVVKYREECNCYINDKINSMDLSKYKDTVSGLIKKDIKALNDQIDFN